MREVERRICELIANKVLLYNENGDYTFDISREVLLLQEYDRLELELSKSRRVVQTLYSSLQAQKNSNKRLQQELLRAKIQAEYFTSRPMVDGSRFCTSQVNGVNVVESTSCGKYQ